MQTSMENYEYKKIVLKWNRQHALCDDSLFTKKLAFAGLSYRQISAVLDAIDTTCHHCWDGDSDCQCWNDE